MEEELPIDSDSSDEDYVPAGHQNELSEEESGNESADPGSDAENTNEASAKRKKPTKAKKRKKIKSSKIEEEERKEEEKENSELVTEEERKKKSDSLWADFMKDCGPPVKKNQPAKTENEEESQPEAKPKVQPLPKPEPAKVTQILTFAGEEVRVEKPVAIGETSKRGGRGSTGGLNSVLSMIGKKGKLSTLEKSKLDWEGFKAKEGIVEDLERHNKGRNGYLEKQDFLQRSDLRQFEIEKSMRSATRRTLNR